MQNKKKEKLYGALLLLFKTKMTNMKSIIRVKITLIKKMVQ